MAASATPSEMAETEVPPSAPDPAPRTGGGAGGGFPPYPPYTTKPAPPSVADTIFAGRTIRRQHKSGAKKPAHPPPRPAKARYPKATDVKLPRRAMKAQARCLKRHGTVLTDRLERIAKPIRRTIIYLWREYANTLPPETIARLRSMLDADEPFKPDQAYEYFINLRRTKKKAAAAQQVNAIKKDILAMCYDKRFLWARNATVAFAKGIQQRLSRPGRFALADGMLRLSNIILDDMCGYMHIRTPSRYSKSNKSKFMLEMADKIAVWIDEILSESDDRMLMMDFDEDEEIEQWDSDSAKAPQTAMPGGASGATPVTGKGSSGSHTTPEGVTPSEGPTPSGGATPLTKNITYSSKFADDFLDMMGDVICIEILVDTNKYQSIACADDYETVLEFSFVYKPESTAGGDDGGGGGGGRNLLAPDPAYLKFKGKMLDAFMLLTSTMYKKGGEQLFKHGKFTQTYSEGADELKRAPTFHASDYNSTLSNELIKTLTDCSKPETPSDLAPYMTEMIDICSKYLSQNAEYNKEKGPAFRMLVKKMRTKKTEQLFQKEKVTRSYGDAAHKLQVAKGLETDHDDPNLSQEIQSQLENLMAGSTPEDLKTDMAETIDVCSKYLSQEAIDEIERGPAFDLLINELEHHGADHFTDFRVVTTKFKAAYVLKSAPGLSAVTPDPATVPVFQKALHAVGDAVVPDDLKDDMNAVIDRCANYLSAFVRDRDIAMANLLKMMKSKPKNTVATRPTYNMDYGTGAKETETTPSLIPYHPIKDIADEAKKNLTKDMQHITPPNLVIANKALIQDVSRHLSQPFALRSGIAGERYPLEFLSAVKHSLGTRPLFKYKSFGQTYRGAADTLMHSGPLEVDVKGEAAENLKHNIKAEMKRGVPEQLAPTIAKELHPTMEKAAAHLANVGMDKGDTLEHLMVMMKEKGESHLAELQGYDQTYTDAARRIENAPSLTNVMVQKDKYVEVKQKITVMADEKKQKIPEKHAELLPEIIDESSKFLAKPLPETHAEKREVLGDLIAKGGEKIVGQEGVYKMTHVEGGEEVKSAPVGKTTAHDNKKKDKMVETVKAVIPNKKVEEMLKDPIEEGAAHLVDTIKGRGEALAVIQKDIDKEKEKDFLTVGDFSKTHQQAATMIEEAPHFGGQSPSPLLVDLVDKRVTDARTTPTPTHIPEMYMKDAQDITTKYLAGVATKECGLDPKALAALEASGKLGKQAPPRAAGESEEERQRRLLREAAAEAARLEREKKRASARNLAQGARPQGDSGDSEKERAAALDILHKQLQSHGNEVFYEQPHLSLTHSQASDWLKTLPIKVEKSVKESGDTARLHKKFEKKLSTLVSPVTPPEMYDSMQDVIIESARQLSEQFVGASYESQSRTVVIGEMQKRGNEIISEIDGASETSFFAAQRLKRAKDLKTDELCTEEAPKLQKKLDEIMRHSTMPRKLGPTVKDLNKDAANYLSTRVTKPHDEIEAHVALLEAMDEAGDNLLVEGQIPKTQKEGAHYLRHLTSLEDKINRPNSSLHSTISSKMKTVTADVKSPGFTKSVMDGVISHNAKLLTSYITLQGEKTEALNIMVQKMDEAGNRVLLRHGNVRKGHKDGADLLRGKTADQLSVQNADPVVARKVEIKLITLMHDNTPPKYESIMKDVIKDATTFLAVHLLEPQIIKICKCMKNVFVQCELWCEEILRRVAKPPCTCSRHVSVQDIKELSHTKHLRICPGSARVIAPGLELAITECQAGYGKNQVCQARKPTPECGSNVTASYVVHSTSVRRNEYEIDHPTHIPPETHSVSDASESDNQSFSPFNTDSERSSTVKSLLLEIHSQNMQYMRKHEQILCMEATKDIPETSPPYRSPVGIHRSTAVPRKQLPSSMCSKIFKRSDASRSSFSSVSEEVTSKSNISVSKSGEARTSISSDTMADWHAMMISLIWNVQAWRKWIQENIDRGSSYKYDPNGPEEEPENSSWISFQRRVSTEALQWRQYNIFSRQLITRLITRYRDKEILSPNRATVRTERYRECASEMLDIISMFNNWTQFLILVIRETGSLQDTTSCNIPLHAMRWNHYKNKIIKYSHDWIKYNLHLKECWEKKYEQFISECVPYIAEPRPVWVVGACGAVPSGAVAAGIYDGEVIWIARTTHRSHVLPAALHPSKHCCSVYSGGAVHYYTKYQVMCNAEVNWVAWRGGEVGAHAVRVADGVYIGRVHYRGSHLIGPVHAPQYRCHVVIFGRPFAFNCYDLLILANLPGQ
ncbi:unnamed protein product [Arctia plantaginis]|uniref:Uncharacterized protein n=1 Tax=Arctia plantaginis TaxID=874455 RepID=A0A8S1A368_ARCPL|nr:unnamed protein product [Arctia plantaginis]